MTDEKILEELRALRAEVERLREENTRIRRVAEYQASSSRGGAGTDASRRAHEATKDFL